MKAVLRTALRTIVPLGALLLSTGATSNWMTHVERTDGGHRLGNPDAGVKLITFESYTCPACARFEREGAGPLKIAYVQPGRVSLEIRHVIRDPVDLTAAMLTNCGAASRFFANHSAFMTGQSEWLGALGRASKAQQDRWYTGDQAARRRAIASDLGFYRIMEGRGYTRAQADRCLNDNAKAQSLAETSTADDEKYGISGTPSFALNGMLLIGTHGWNLLRPQLDARL